MKPDESDGHAPAYLGYRLFHLAWLAFLALHWLLSLSAWSRLGDGFLQSGHPAMRWLSLAYGPVLMISALYPDRRGLFATALALFAAAKIDALPWVPNHILCALIIHVALLSALLLSAGIRDPRRGVARAYTLFAPPLRIVLVLVYLFAVLHKLNVDYFNTDVSCGSVLYRQVLDRMPWLPDAAWARRVSIYGTVVIEALLPVLLLVRSWRGWGVMLGILFHFGLSLHPNEFIFGFSAEVLALYVLFLPSAWTRRLGKGLVEITSAPGARRAAVAVVGLGIAGGALYLTAAAGPDEGIWEPLRRLEGLGRGGWYAWSLVVFSAVGVALWRGPRGGTLVTGDGSTASRARWALALFPLLVTLNGLTPYLGLKTATNFSMFSNLRVVGERNNHWFMPSGLLPVDHQVDLVEIERASVPGLQQLGRRGGRLPYFELRRLLGGMQRDGVRVAFRRGARSIEVAWPRDRGHDAFRPPPWPARKLLVYRVVPPDGPCPCQW